jgi:acetoin utilization deacetylase AcuC-like enzyme
MGRTGLVWEPRCLLHQCGLGHPERPQRLEAIRNGLEQAGLWQRCEHLAARPASTRELLRCHTESYLELVHKEVAAGREDLSTGDTPFRPTRRRPPAWPQEELWWRWRP